MSQETYRENQWQSPIYMKLQAYSVQSYLQRINQCIFPVDFVKLFRTAYSESSFGDWWLFQFDAVNEFKFYLQVKIEKGKNLQVKI